MKRFAGRVFAAMFVFGLVAPAFAADRTADQIVKEIEAIPRPTTYEEFQKGNAKRALLVPELMKAFPDDSRLPKYLPQYWIGLAQAGKGEQAIAEIDKVLPKTKDAMLKKQGPQVAGTVLYITSSELKPDDPKKAALEDRLLKEYGETPYAGMVKGLRKQRAAIGKPFDLEFTDAMKGQTVSIKGLKGKVVVLDFWATWCGPCIAEMPKMKKLYAEYKDKGVEFIGVSLDQPKEKGGLDKLKKYVTDNEIAWPQYYQGNFWQSEFSASWGINSIPCVFIVDADGKLASTEARGKLEEMIPELLKKAKSNGAGE